MLSPPPIDGPSPTALRAFEAAARNNSFSRAAQELHVTPAAIAQQIKALEAWAEQPLFERTARGVILNEAGLRARPALTDAFHRLAAAANLLRDGATTGRTVRLAALPAIAELWLTPRLAELRDRLPGHGIAIHALDRRPDLQRDGFDVTAYFAPTVARSDELVLVTSPDLGARLTDLRDLASIPRLRDLAWDHHWLRWGGTDLDAAGADSTVDFTLFAMAVAAACRGEGALVGRRSLLDDLLVSGDLVEPFDRRVATGDALEIRRRDDPALAPLDAWGGVIVDVPAG